MSTRRRVEEEARRLGVTLDIRDGDVDAWSPKGWVFAATGCHSLVASRWDDEKQADLYRSVLADLRLGLSPCEDPECEGCGP